MRRWLHALGWVWKRPKLVAKDADPHRVTRLARIRWVFEPLTFGEAMVCADELDIQLLPKVGCAWMPHGAQSASTGRLDSKAGGRLAQWATTPVQIENRLEHCSQIPLAWAPSACVLLGGREPRLYDRPWRIGQIRGRPFPRLVYLPHEYTLLC
jgi:hypothetical protein